MSERSASSSACEHAAADPRSSVWVLKPGPGNPRNSEGAFIRLKDGRVAFYYSAFTGDTARDHTAADIVRIVSSDQGKSWSSPERIFTAEEHNAMNIMSISLLRMQDSSIGIFFLVRRSWQDMRPVLRRSFDEGRTFGEVQVCSTRKGYFVMNNDRVLRLRSGRILIPLAEHIPLEAGQGIPKMSGASVTCMYSDDDGHHWQESAVQLDLMGIRACRSGLQEPGLIELNDGRLYGWARTDLGCQYEFFSPDGGMHFTAPVPSEFTSPLSPLSMKRIPENRLIALWNPIPEYQTRKSDRRNGGRTPLVYALSDHDGAQWSQPVILENDPCAGYCYTAIFPMDDRLLLAYCSGSIQELPSCLNQTTIRVIPYEKLAARESCGIHPMGIGF